MPKISNAPDHEFNPEGLTVRDLIERLKAMPPDHKIWVETAGDPNEDPEGTLIGRIDEVQDGRDGSAYLRLHKTTKSLIDQLVD
jgi:hypothetical protein